MKPRTPFVYPAILAVLILGGGALSTPVVHAADCANAYASGSAAPTGYGASWNLFTTAKELLVQGSACSATSFTLKVGSGDAAQYVYKQGYVWLGTRWQQLTLTESTGQAASDVWLTKDGATTVTASGADTYVVGYVCQQINGVWKCGCSDQTCSTPYWQLQKMTITSPTGGTGSAGGNAFAPQVGPVSLRSDGTILVGGQPYFPFGFYIPNGTNGAALQNMITNFSNWGLNLIWVDGPITDSATLNLAVQKHVWLIMNGWQGPANDYAHGTVPPVVYADKDSQAVLAWNVCDDCDQTTAWSMDAATALVAKAALKAVDPNHLMYGPTTRDGEIYGSQSAAQSFDIIAPEEYPCCSSDLGEAYTKTKHTIDVAPGTGRSIRALPQTWSYGAAADRYPSGPEVRLMTYLALAAGSKGVHYYNYPGDSSPIITEIKALAPELKILSSPMLDGTLTRAVAQGSLFASTWDYNNTSMLSSPTHVMIHWRM